MGTSLRHRPFKDEHYGHLWNNTRMEIDNEGKIYSETQGTKMTKQRPLLTKTFTTCGVYSARSIVIKHEWYQIIITSLDQTSMPL